MQTKEQRRLYKKHYREKNREKIKQYKIEYNKKNHDKVLASSIRRNKVNTNITVEKFNDMYDKQEGRCGICGKHQSELKKRLSIDHNHTTGKIRGLLCTKCNFMLGYANDDIILLNKAIEYINNTD